jgi:hypothetical protein
MEIRLNKRAKWYSWWFMEFGIGETATIQSKFINAYWEAKVVYFISSSWADDDDDSFLRMILTMS